MDTNAQVDSATIQRLSTEAGSCLERVQASRPDIVSADVLLSLLDRDWRGTLQRLEESGDLTGLGIALCYGASLPQGKEFGRLAERRCWIESQRACMVRQCAAAKVKRLRLSEREAVAFVRKLRRKRGYSRLLRSIIWAARGRA